MKIKSAGNCVFFNHLSCLYLKNEICLLINTIVLFLKVWLVSLFFSSLFYYTSLPSLSTQGGYSAPSFSPWQGSFQGTPRTVPPHRRQSESVSLTPLPPASLPEFPSACSAPPSTALLLSGLQACAKPALPGLSSLTRPCPSTAWK